MEELQNATPIPATPVAAPTMEQTKFCKHCGSKISINAVVCTSCGLQVEELKSAAAAAQQPQIVITNTNTNTNTNSNMNGMMGMKTPKNKWVALVLCFFFGAIGVHRFYEGKIGSGVLYFFTLGLFGIGVLIDFIIILTKPNPYYV